MTLLKTNNFQVKIEKKEKSALVILLYLHNFSDYISQYGDDESIGSARGTMNINKQMANLNLLNNNHSGAAATVSSGTGIKLGPVMMKKQFGGNSPNTLNNFKKLPTNSSKIRSTPLTPEKVLFNDKSQSAKTSPTKKVNIDNDILCLKIYKKKYMIFLFLCR